MSNIKVAIVDDHRLFRTGIESLISQNEDIEIILSADDGKDFLGQLNKTNLPDIVLLDLTMPEMNGFEVLGHLKKKYPSVRSIALSMHEDGNYVVKCIRSGAFGYLLKNTDKEELVEAIHHVYRGKKYFNQEVSERMIDIISTEGTHIKKLSAKEAQILQLISEGSTTKEIASELYISTRTVETHRVNMLKKLEVKNTAELITKASKLNLI